MRRILLDQNIPLPLARELSGHEVVHASQLARGRLTNGDLLAAAQRNAFDIMVSADRGILHEQNHAKRRIALVMLGSNRWLLVRLHLEAIRRAVDEVEAGGLRNVRVERATGRGRG